MSKMNLPSVPRSADRDTTVFLQSLKKAIENLSAGDKAELSAAAKSYVLRIDKNTREDLVGVIGDEAGVGAILDKIKGQITESELSIGLGERIAKIDSNEGAINAERQERIAELILTNQAIIDEALARANAVSGNEVLIVQESEARLAEDEAITRNLNLLNTQINGDGVSSSSSIVQQLTTVSNKTDTNANEISGLTSTFNNEMYGAQGIIARNAQTAASAASANASDISGLFVQVNPRMAGDTDRWAGENDPLKGVGVWSERSARIEEGMYTAERFDAMSARVDGNASAITTERNIRAKALLRHRQTRYKQQ
ncbi:hypothetical protein [Psychrobacter sp.]|uniref:hypothetical protein n=1 Tax=Psychrobacter sp. TaxID=56811 RepID=UPI002FD9DF00